MLKVNPFSEWIMLPFTEIKLKLNIELTPIHFFRCDVVNIIKGKPFRALLFDNIFTLKLRGMDPILKLNPFSERTSCPRYTNTHQCEWHVMTRMTRPDCPFMCNFINTEREREREREYR